VAPVTSGQDGPASLAGHDEAAARLDRASGRARSRWAVHLALLITVIAALVPLLLFNVNPRVTVHIVVACVFLGLVIAHLAAGRNTRIELPGLRLFIGWHSLSSLLFLGYLIAHVVRRRKRLRRSRIR